jgi:restriction endonuclease S subunit
LRVKDRDALDPAWLGLWLRFLHQSGYFAKNCNKWIGQAGFPPTKIAELGIPIPELGEQYRIVARIEALMADLKEVRELFLQTQLELLAVEESLLELAYSIGGENGELPEGWRWASLSALCTINPRRPRLDRAPATPTSFVSMNAIDEAMGAICKIELRQYSEVARGYTYFEEGDVLFAKITPCMQNGKCAIAQGLADSIGFGSTEFHVLRPGPQVTSEWVHRYLRRRAFRAQAEKHFRGAVGQQRVPETFLKAAKIPTPPSKAIESRVIRRIDAVAAEVAEGNATIEAGLQQLAVAERSALDRAFRGEL